MNATLKSFSSRLYTQQLSHVTSNYVVSLHKMKPAQVSESDVLISESYIN